MKYLKSALVIPSSKSVRRLSGLPALAILCCASHAFAAAPAVVVDAQQSLGTGFNDPQGIAVAPNGTVYLADTQNNRIVKLTPNLPGNSASAVVNTGTLSSPEGLAVDAAGDLFIGDTPNASARILEVVASGGVLTNTVKTIYSGGLLNNPISLTINSANPAFANTLFIGDSTFFGSGAIYSINLGSRTPTPVQVSIKGLPGGFTPSALALDLKGDLYIANSNNGGVYVAPAAGGNAQSILTGSFNISEPQGLALDASGDLFILSQLSGFSQPNGEQVIEVPNASSTIQSTPYIIPTTNLETGGGMALDPAGNLDIAEAGTAGFFGSIQQNTGLIAQLDFLNPVYLGAANVYGNNGIGVTFNFEFNSSATFSGFTAVTTGDAGNNSDVIKVPTQRFGAQTGNCQFGKLTGLTAYQPYSCYQNFEATPQYVGTRASAIQVQGASASKILSSSPVYELGDAAAQIAYPLDVTTTLLGLIQPQGVAISGFNSEVYIADLASGKVYSISGLNGSKPTSVYTGAANSATALSAPSAVAMNGEGDLYIADFNLGEVIVVPTTTAIAPFVLNTGSVELQHPISLAIDELGDLYVGDAGSEGEDASSAAPGFVAVVPSNGSPFTLALNSVSIIFPQALAINSINGNLVIGDGGDGSDGGQLVQVTPAGAASVLSTNSNPTGLSFDAAGNLYILDGTLNNITEVQTNQTSRVLAIANPSALSYPSALASSAGAQSFVVANLGGGSANSLVYLNGNSVSFAFGSQANNSKSASQTATVANIGNQSLTLSKTGNGYYSPNPIPAFGLGTTTTCATGDVYTSLTSCFFAVEFEPTSKYTGAQSEQVTINSNAYNSGTPALNLTGTGTGASPQVKANLKAATQTLQTHNRGRKSFAAAKFK